MSVKESSTRKIVTLTEDQEKQIKRLASFFGVSEASIIRLAVDSFVSNVRRLLDRKEKGEKERGYL